MPDKAHPTDDEVDLAALFAALWAHKALIVLITASTIFIAGYQALTMEKQYTASAVFEIQGGKSNGINLRGELGALASIAGISGLSSNSSSEILLERIMAREFILDATERLSLRDDTYFNTYSPKEADPQWKAIIKKLIGWSSTRQEKNAVIEKTIQKNYGSYVNGSITGAGAIVLSVSHRNPILAAKYANGLMEQIRQLVEEEEDKDKEFRLSYLAETLADALLDLENAQSNLKNYALQNSTAAPENFITVSMQLDALRMERSEAKEFINVLEKLKELIEFGDLDNSAYQALRLNSPLVDDINFRRVLGMSETISAWSWPSLETISNVNETLNDRFSRLSNEIANIEENAKKYATNAEDLAKYTRDVKIAEATFRVLTEQVKSQTLVAGFKPNTFKVFAYASPPLSPTSPNRTVFLGLGAVFGLFFGSALSVFNSIRKGVFYLRSSIISAAQATIAIRTKPIRRLVRLSDARMLASLEKHKPASLEEAQISIANEKLICLVNAGGKPLPSQTAKILATLSSQTGRKVALCDMASRAQTGQEDIASKNIGGLTMSASSCGFDTVQKGFSGLSFLTSANFKNNLEALLSKYDQVFICSDDLKSNAMLIALKSFHPSVVVLAGLHKTKKTTLKHISSLYPISILFHD